MFQNCQALSSCQKCTPGDKIWWVLIVVLGIVYVGNAWTPSSYAISLRMIGAPQEGLVFGTPRGIRGDEYLILTPYFQMAIRNDFGARNEFSPYKEAFKSAYALPVRDWSLMFKPQLWAFFWLNAAQAYSLYHFILITSFVVGYTILLRQLGAGPTASVLVSLILFSSHFVQVWWTNNGPTFAFAPWPLVLHLTRWRWYARAPTIFYATCLWLMSLLYPPFIIGASFAFLVLLVAFRSDGLRVRRALPSIAAVALAAGVVFLYYGDLVSEMRNSEYPGRREYGGGNVAWPMAVANIFPYMTTLRFEPLLPWLGGNASEVGVVGSFLPLALLVFADRRKLLHMVRERPWPWIIWLIGLLAVLAWMVFPVPVWVGRPLLWNFVAPVRIQWAEGLILTLGLGVMASAVPWRFTALRSIIASAAVISAWLFSKYLLVGILYPQNVAAPVVSIRDAWFDWIFIVLLWTAFVVTRICSVAIVNFRQYDRQILLSVVALTGLMTFGTFNPVQSAKPIFSPPETLFVRTLRQMAAAHPEGFVALEGSYGAVLNGIGVPAINHFLLTPQMKFLKTRFQDLLPEAFLFAFNRHTQIIPWTAPGIEVLAPNAVFVPIERFGLQIPVSIDAETASRAISSRAEIGGSVDVHTMEKIGPGRWRVKINGWCFCEGSSPEQRLVLGLQPALLGRAEVEHAFAVRLPRLDVVSALGNQALAYSGFVLVFELTASPEIAVLPIEPFHLHSNDPARGLRQLSIAKP